MAEADPFEHRRCLLPGLGVAQLELAQGELDVAQGRHVGPERIVLEDHGQAPAFGGQVHAGPGDDLAADGDRAIGQALDPRLAPQQGGLARPRRPEQDQEGARVDVEVSRPRGPVWPRRTWSRPTTVDTFPLPRAAQAER